MTLVQFWTQERDLYRDKKTALTAAVTQLQQRLDKAKNADTTKGDAFDGLKTAQSALADIDAKIADKRAALAKSTIPAEAQALVIAIRDLQIEQRAKSGEILDMQEEVDAAQRELDAQGKLLQRVTSRLAEREASLKMAEDAETRRGKLKTRVTTAPVKDVPTQANTATTGAEHNAAKARIDELPAELFGLAEKRFNLRVKRIADAADEVTVAENEQVSQREAWGGEGKAEQERTAFLRAEQAVQSFASTAQPEYDRAINLYKAIAAVSLLSASETGSIAATAARTAAAANANAAVDALGGIDIAALDLEKTEFSKLAADADADLSADATVTGKKNALAAAKTTFHDDSTTNYPDKQVTDEWQAIPTDRSWKSVVDYLDANATLTRLAGLSANGLVTDMDNKEAAYAAALADLAKARRRLEYVEDALALRRERLEDISGSRAMRLVSAVRGDSF